MDDKELNDILNEWDSKDKKSEVQDGGDTVPAAEELPGEVYIPEEEIEQTSDDDDTEDDEDEYDEEEYNDDEEYDDEDEDRRSRRKRKKRSGAGRVIFALVMVTLVISVAALSAAGVIIVTKELLGLDRIDEKVDIEIPENSSSSEIADMLAQEGIIERPVLFKIFSRLKGADGSFIAGVHVLNPNMTYNDIIETLQENVEADREYVTLTFPEGIRLDEAAQKLEEAGVCSKAEFIRAFNSEKIGFDFEDMVQNNVLKYYKMEGYFFPDTYDFYLEEEPRTVVKKVFKNFDYRVTPDYYGRMKDLDMDLEEVMTLASMVQREAGDKYNMKMVASVFLNRLADPENYPLLQSDPTSAYVREVVEPGLEVYSKAICDAYDTYKGPGLPPGPICNPGLDAIEAVLYPADTDYYYFCSSEDEEFFYAETLAEHEQNLIEAGITG